MKWIEKLQNKNQQNLAKIWRALAPTYSPAFYWIGGVKQRTWAGNKMSSSLTTRAIGAVLHRFSNGVLPRRNNAFFLHSNFCVPSSLSFYFVSDGDFWNVFTDLCDSGTNLLSRGLSSASSFSSLDTTQEVNCNNNFQSRMIWTFPPVCMGRRSSKIAGRKVALFPLSMLTPGIKRFFTSGETLPDSATWCWLVLDTYSAGCRFRHHKFIKYFFSLFFIWTHCWINWPCLACWFMRTPCVW